MRMPTVALLSICLTACGLEETSEFFGSRCDGLELKVVDQAVAPPANINVMVRVETCEGAKLDRAVLDTDFTLSEDGALVSDYESAFEVRAAGRTVTEYTLMALDMSGSVARSGFKEDMINGARKLVGQVGGHHKVAIAGFDGRPGLEVFAHFTDDIDRLHEALDGITTTPVVDDSTNLYGAVVTGLDMLDSAVRNERLDGSRLAQGALVVFTDGMDRAARVSGHEAFSRTEVSDHATFAIGLGSEIDPLVLSKIGRDAALTVSKASELLAAFAEIAAELEARAQRDFIVSYCSPARAGNHTLKVEVGLGTLFGSTVVDFSAEQFRAGCDPSLRLLD